MMRVTLRDLVDRRTDGDVDARTSLVLAAASSEEAVAHGEEGSDERGAGLE